VPWKAKVPLFVSSLRLIDEPFALNVAPLLIVKVEIVMVAAKVSVEPATISPLNPPPAGRNRAGQTAVKGHGRRAAGKGSGRISPVPRHRPYWKRLSSACRL